MESEPMIPTDRKIKVVTILGTRPEIIRLSEIIKKFDLHFSHRLVFTSQNRESYVGADFFSELGLKSPDKVFENTSSTSAEFLANLFIEIERELTENRPDVVVILGDTNTSLSAIVVRKLGIPIYHLEAGNRSFDYNVPEEINRKIVDHISDFNLAYSRHAEANLLKENFPQRQSIVIGTPLREVIASNLKLIADSTIVEKLKLRKNQYFLVSAHRQENIDLPDRLNLLVECLNAVAEKYQYPIVVTTHPRLKDKLARNKVNVNKLVEFIEPLGFIDYCNLQINSYLVLSDSGSVSEECSLLGFKAITLRDSMERPEALETGSILMSGLRPEKLISSIDYVASRTSSISLPMDYAIENTSDRVINFILSTHHARNFWTGKR
jgi:UDP-N-acetyl-L-fucosamine synthase